MPIGSVEQAIDDFKAGKIVIIVDDEDRENEGDLAMAAEKVTPAAINFMATHGRGLICMPMMAREADGAETAHHGAGQHRAARHGLHRFGRRPEGHDDGDIRAGTGQRRSGRSSIRRPSRKTWAVPATCFP